MMFLLLLQITIKAILRPNRWILSLFLIIALSPVNAQVNSIYQVNQKGDSSLTPYYIDNVCQAVRSHEESEKLAISRLEELILTAAGTSRIDSNSSSKTLRWHKKFGSQLICDSTKNYPNGSFLEQMVLSNFREFANLIGPNNHLTLETHIEKPDHPDNLFNFVDSLRLELEARHDNRRFEFQQDEAWRNIMFFYFLFSEYKINYDAELKK